MNKILKAVGALSELLSSLIILAFILMLGGVLIGALSLVGDAITGHNLIEEIIKPLFN